MTLPFTPVSIANPSVDKVNLAPVLDKDLQSVVNWVRKWLVNFNAPKTKMLSFTHHRDLFLPAISMADAKQHTAASCPHIFN